MLVGQARGVILLAIAERGLPVYEYTPLQVKGAIVGYGRASKPQIQKTLKVLLDTDEYPRPDDAADAVAVAICHVHSTKLASFLVKCETSTSGSSVSNVLSNSRS